MHLFVLIYQIFTSHSKFQTQYKKLLLQQQLKLIFDIHVSTKYHTKLYIIIQKRNDNTSHPN